MELKENIKDNVELEEKKVEVEVDEIKIEVNGVECTPVKAQGPHESEVDLEDEPTAAKLRVYGDEEKKDLKEIKRESTETQDEASSKIPPKFFLIGGIISLLFIIVTIILIVVFSSGTAEVSVAKPSKYQLANEAAAIEKVVLSPEEEFRQLEENISDYTDKIETKMQSIVN
jgi:hypothetical protein